MKFSQLSKFSELPATGKRPGLQRLQPKGAPVYATAEKSTFVRNNLDKSVEGGWGMSFEVESAGENEDHSVRVEEVDEGLARVKLKIKKEKPQASGGGIENVEGDEGSAANVKTLRFTVAEDPGAGVITVEDLGGGVALVKIPVLPAPPESGFVVLGRGDGENVAWKETQSCRCDDGTSIDGGGA